MPLVARPRLGVTVALLAGLSIAPMRPAAAQGATSTSPAAATHAADREAVRRAVLDYVEGFYEGDSTKLLRSIAPTVQKSGYARSHPDSAYRRSTMTFPDQFLGFARGVREGRIRTPAGAPKTVTLLDVEDQTASAKLVAWWGIDYLLLGKHDGRWMITHVLWQSPPGPSGSSSRPSAPAAPARR
jgi:hypothetical protein